MFLLSVFGSIELCPFNSTPPFCWKQTLEQLGTILCHRYEIGTKGRRQTDVRSVGYDRDQSDDFFEFQGVLTNQGWGRLGDYSMSRADGFHLWIVFGAGPVTSF